MMNNFCYHNMTEIALLALSTNRQILTSFDLIILLQNPKAAYIRNTENPVDEN